MRSKPRTAKRGCVTQNINGGVNDSADEDLHREPVLRVAIAKLNAMARSPVKLVDGTRSLGYVTIRDLAHRLGKAES